MTKSRGRSVAPKTVICQYEDCGKTFCHSYHLYRHQREKHGQQYKYYKASWQDTYVACCYHNCITTAHDFLQTANFCPTPVTTEFWKMQLNSLNEWHAEMLEFAFGFILKDNPVCE